MTIFLIGFMGSGKSYWGKLWAANEGFSFVDLDLLIEQRTGKSVAAIFEEKGEDYFREQERQILTEWVEEKNTIIACGGGTPCFYDNMDRMNDRGTTIYLKTTPALILERVKDEINQRPLLKNLNEAEILFFIEKKLKEREPVYRQAKITVQVDQLHENYLKESVLPGINN